MCTILDNRHLVNSKAQTMIQSSPRIRGNGCLHIGIEHLLSTAEYPSNVQLPLLKGKASPKSCTLSVSPVRIMSVISGLKFKYMTKQGHQPMLRLHLSIL